MKNLENVYFFEKPCCFTVIRPEIRGFFYSLPSIRVKRVIVSTHLFDATRAFVSRDNSPLSKRIAKVVVITLFSVTERIPAIFGRKAQAL